MGPVLNGSDFYKRFSNCEIELEIEFDNVYVRRVKTHRTGTNGEIQNFILVKSNLIVKLSYLTKNK